ncbi:DUF4149 domain-containing protein [Noviherbaspirillum sp. UKPF54]|uniref:DUF4149 domain-containing protein n=1 Tax=Noviherbaspirillum sp. UKPF54 TaxID=2601898 RepID=UPI0011B14912|nr:DUF4149 domain-containing protein [Noviherbaspirillum sp. UKPF54]QDZ28328.1 DUF4149 domain-containing protein [Noviherbaspirillum sp. UKPF54]
MLAAPARLLIATLWAGSLWTIGYLVAPTLFATLDDKVLAGSIAGSLFRIEAWLSVFCATVLLALAAGMTGPHSGKPGRRLSWIVAGMLACTVIGYFGLHPYMAALKEAVGPGGVMAADARTQFGILHGISSAFYLVQSLLAIALVLAVR